jgi:hypothetical protein
MFRAGCSLEILEQCTSLSPHMPSWVPDWTNRDHFRLFSGRSCYHAVLNRPPIFHFNTANTKLSVQGFKIGDIDGLGVSYYESYQSTNVEDALVQSTWSNNAYGSNECLRDTLWRVLTGNRTPNGKLAPNAYQCLLRCPLVLEDEDHVAGAWRGRKAFNHLLRQNKDLKLAGKTLGSFFPSTGKADPEASRDALERIFRFHRSRRLAVTVQGHFGLVPIATRKGDLVFLLLGCNIPMVLRVIKGNKYKIIGGCYLQGFMEGEAMEDLEGENVQHGTVVLC